MKATEKNIEKVTSRFGRCALAALLISLTCISPATYSAFADESNDASATEATTQTVTPANTTHMVTSTTATDVSTNTVSATTALAANSLTTSDTNADEETTDDSSITTVAEDTAADETATTEDSHTFNVGTTLELMEAVKYDINTQSNESFVINLTDDLTLVKPTETYDSHGNRINLGNDRLSITNGNTVTILGNGHTITYTNESANNLSLGTIGGNLILGNADGTDSLTVTFEGTSEAIPLITVVRGGTCVINDGVTLSNNTNSTGLAGGAICIQSNGVVTMNGGLIENCTNTITPYGGAVAVDGGEFHMNGGTIKGNSEPDYAYGYEGAGGAVAVGLRGTSSTFTMGGNAVIKGNSAKYGGGVYVGPNASFTMSDSAAILNNTASEYGGGVYVEQGGTFTMGEGNIVTGNSAQYGGGILNFGTATVTNLYDNNASVAGDDIYNNGTITMDDVKADWSLSTAQSTSDPNYVPPTDTSTPTDNTKPDLGTIAFRSAVNSFFAVPQADASTTTTGATMIASSKNIDGWYYDGHRETGATDTEGNAIVEHNRWNANADTADTPQYLQSYVVTGQPTTETMALKAAHGAVTTTEPATHDISVMWENEDGTVLYTMNHVDPADVPEADEYNELSGNENPTEPDENNYHYDFEGWVKTGDGQGDVIYIADYKAVPEGDAPDTPAGPDTPNTPGQPAYPANQPALHDDSTDPAAPAANNTDHGTKATDGESSTAPHLGDDVLPLALITGTATGLALLALGYARRANRKG